MVETRMGSGKAVSMSRDEIETDIKKGVEKAVENGGVDPLSQEEIERLVELHCIPAKFISLEKGEELVTTFDGGSIKFKRLDIFIDRIKDAQIFERVLCTDSVEFAHVDYSFKPVKPIIDSEQIEMKQALQVTMAPMFYGAMPNLSLYYQPVGSEPNPSNLMMEEGDIEQARRAIERTVTLGKKDMVFVSRKMYEVGADGINFDTVGSAGEGDFLASLQAVEELKELYPDMCIEMGMASEFILGMHGELEYKGVKLAGLYPHEQVKLAEEAGVTIFGPVVNVKANKSSPWNLARALTLYKACKQEASIPIHANVGMGVGGVPMTEVPPVDATTRTSLAMAEIGMMDGL